VRIGERRFELHGDRPFAFGRADDDGIVGLDPGDTGISRLAGRIVPGGGWLVENRSEARPVLVEFPRVVRRQAVVPGNTVRLGGPAVILVPGRALTHALQVDVPLIASTSPAGTQSSVSQPTDRDPLTRPDHLALVAIGEGYLQRWPRHDPNPRSYEDAAARLDMSPTALRRRIERLRDHLAAEGLFVAAGPHALRDLVEYHIDIGRLHVSDLDLLPATTSASPPAG
jgi:hypothetical protein